MPNKTSIYSLFAFALTAFLDAYKVSCFDNVLLDKFFEELIKLEFVYYAGD